MDYKIRKTKLEDMKSVEDAHRRSILEICSNDYTLDQIEKFSGVKYSAEIWDNSVNNEYHIVVEVSGRVEGMCHAKLREDGDGEIVGVYFSKVIAGQGIGRDVVEMAFDYLDQFKPKNIILTGTLTAKPFYEKMGFVEVEKKKINCRGALLDCFKMEKHIND
ncbi:MAG: GNAT family N-acetyltransferase [Halobacteriovoraceae bacterium]|nr:GNAT family N-acetyltransferase [Halobacteriovoraceae bacterium]